MKETERKFTLLKDPLEIERDAAAFGTLKSRRLIQQRYFDPKGSKVRLLKCADGEWLELEFTMPGGKTVGVKVDQGFHDALKPFCSPAKARGTSGDTSSRLRGSDDWIFRIRRSTSIQGTEPKHVLTLKKPVSALTCDEPECCISSFDHDQFAKRCGPALRKRRVCVKHRGRTWEIDTFANAELEGLAFCEIELPSETTTFAKPDWAGREVTFDKAYRNAVIQKRIA